VASRLPLTQIRSVDPRWESVFIDELGYHSWESFYLRYTFGIYRSMVDTYLFCVGVYVVCTYGKRK
jgi:hypothetical protein